MKLCIKNGILVSPLTGIHEKYDILIQDGIITQIEKDIQGDDFDRIDASHQYILPGLVDMHCHLRDPGYEYKEDISTGIKAAARGGFTSIACMANTLPPVDHAAILFYIQMKAKKENSVKVYPIGAVTKGLKGEELSEMGELLEAGAVAFSDDGKPIMNSYLMKLALQYAQNFDALIISHCEDINLANEGVMNEGYTSTILGLKGISRAAEETMIARDLILAETLNSRVHIAHISTKGSVTLIRNAKKNGVRVTCETAPHYFSASEEWVVDYNTNTRVNPPLRTKEDIAAIKEGLQDGTIDCIATDHAPHHRDDKDVEYDLAASGISGFETAFSLGITNLVHTGVLTIDQLIEKMSINPARILRISGGIISVGSSADLIIADLDQEYRVDITNFLSKGKNTPFDKSVLRGKVSYTMVNGRIVMQNA